MKNVAQDVAGGGGQERDGIRRSTRHLPAAEPTPNTRMPPPALALWRHLKEKHVKEAAQDVAEDVAQDVAEGVLGAAGDGGVKVLIVARAIFSAAEPAPNLSVPPFTHALR